MAWPPPLPPAGRTDDTLQAGNHPSDHNLATAALSTIALAAVPRFATPAARDAEWPAPPTGAYCATVDTDPAVLWQRRPAGWVVASPVWGAGVFADVAVGITRTAVPRGSLVGFGVRTDPGFGNRAQVLYPGTYGVRAAYTVNMTPVGAYLIGYAVQFRATTQIATLELITGLANQAWGVAVVDGSFALQANDSIEFQAMSDAGTRQLSGFRSTYSIQRLGN